MMPNIILDLRECTDEQKHLVLRVMETLEYTWATGTRATSTPLPVNRFTYLYMNEGGGRKELLYGTRVPVTSTIEEYDYVVSDVVSWFALGEMREQQMYIDDMLA